MPEIFIYANTGRTVRGWPALALAGYRQRTASAQAVLYRYICLNIFIITHEKQFKINGTKDHFFWQTSSLRDDSRPKPVGGGSE